MQSKNRDTSLELSSKQRIKLLSCVQNITSSISKAMATKIYIVYYSTWGHVAALAEEMKKGADAVAGVEATVWRVAETLSEEVLGKMGAAPAREAHRVITPRDLADADGVLLGFPTRFRAFLLSLLYHTG